MQLSSLLVLAISAATTVSGMALEPRGDWSCPAAQPKYCGWFDKDTKEPPCCKEAPPAPKPHPKPSCGSGKTPYCAKDPGHFCPYDEKNDFCKDDGTTHCDCYDETLTVVELEVVLGELYCPLQTAYSQLGSSCLCNDVCVAVWIDLDLGCSQADLLSLTADAVVSIIGDISTTIGIDLGAGLDINV